MRLKYYKGKGEEKMLSFTSDYIAGAHPAVLQRLIDTNLESTSGYGTDEYTAMAKDKIKAACGLDNADVYFLVGGTQTNQIVIDTMLKQYEGVIAAQTGHVACHEAGAIEYSRHKVLTVPQENGKLKASDVRELIETFYSDESYEHMVFPGMTYISYPTEYGTLYSKQEITDIYAVCKEYNIPLFIDGARLGYGLMSDECDLTLQELAQLCDVFYIGGTKVGALFGEAIVFTHDNMPKHFITMVKQHGALLAKGRLLGVQFDALFTDDLYFEIGKHAIDLAKRMKQMFVERGYELFIDSPTNQQFFIMDDATVEKLRENVAFEVWEKYDKTRTVVRFVTSWSTTSEDIDRLEQLI